VKSGVSGPVVDDCRLCGALGVRLRDSHIMPKWAYRRARDETSTSGSRDPVRVQEGVVIQTSSQITEYMLCEDCEQRLGRDEDYVSKLASQEDGVLGLTSLLLPGTVIKTGPSAEGIPTRAAPISHLDCQSIARFAASVFWRAHVARRHRFDGLHLWNPQAEALRRFVLGKSPLPERMCLNLIVPVDGDELTSVYAHFLATPGTGKKGEDSAHQFIVAGLLFYLTTGSQTAPLICLACGSSPHALIQHWKAIPYLMNAARMLLDAEPKGRGARALHDKYR
jgi:hypothetical protein